MKKKFGARLPLTPRHFLPISGHPAHPTRPATGLVKVDQTQSKLVQHKLGKIFSAQNHHKQTRENPRKTAEIKAIKVN